MFIVFLNETKILNALISITFSLNPQLLSSVCAIFVTLQIRYFSCIFHTANTQLDFTNRRVILEPVPWYSALCLVT